MKKSIVLLILFLLFSNVTTPLISLAESTSNNLETYELKDDMNYKLFEMC